VTLSSANAISAIGVAKIALKIALIVFLNISRSFHFTDG
jgi:hypothetical protein